MGNMACGGTIDLPDSYALINEYALQVLSKGPYKICKIPKTVVFSHTKIVPCFNFCTCAYGGTFAKRQIGDGDASIQTDI